MIMTDLDHEPGTGIVKTKYRKGASLLKKITGGHDDPLQVEAKYAGDADMVNPSLTVLAASNHNPRWVNDGTEEKAWAQRLVPITLSNDAARELPEGPDPDLVANILAEHGTDVSSVIASDLVDAYQNGHGRAL